MNRLQLLRTLYKHTKLSAKRNVAWEQNKTAKYFVYISSCLVLAYLAFLAIMFSLIINDSESVTGYEFMYAILPFILLLDFLSRFAFQQTPSQLVKPYSLLPIPRYACIDSFLFTTLINTYNFLWFALYIPFAIMSVVFSEGLGVATGFLLGLWILTLINSQWYLLVRSLVNCSMKWWLLPIAVYALIALPMYTGEFSIVNFFETYMTLGEGFSFWHPLYYICAVGALSLMLETNRRLQHYLVWQETSKEEDTTVKHVFQFSFLDKRGDIGEYLKLEVKSIMRNKNLRKSFISSIVAIILFSLLLSFTDVYDNMIMTNFWYLYCFALFGAIILVKIMCYEGNYIDCLMVRKENIILLLRAKYYFYTALLVFPMILMLPTVFTEKGSLLMIFAYAFFTAGVEYCLFFQMAVYNKQTMPLNTKFIGKGSMENSYIQVVMELIIFTVPIGFVSVLNILCGETVAYITMIVLGLIFMAAHKLWIRNIYNRMMKRRYENMESMRASR